MKRYEDGKKIKSTVRTTIVLPDVLHRNLSTYALVLNKKFNAAAVEAITEYLLKRNIKPDAYPTLEITYKK